MGPKKQRSRNRIKQQLNQLREITSPKTGDPPSSGDLDEPMEKAEKVQINIELCQYCHQDFTCALSLDEHRDYGWGRECYKDENNAHTSDQETLDKVQNIIAEQGSEDDEKNSNSSALEDFCGPNYFDSSTHRVIYVDVGQRRKLVF